MFRPTRSFQAGLDTVQARREREKNSLSLRRKDREMKLQIKRKKIMSQNATSSSSTSSSSSHSQSNRNQGHGNKLSTDQNEQSKMMQELPRYVHGCFTDHKATIYECTQRIRQILSFAHNVPIKEVIDSGVIPRIIQFLRWKDMPQLQFESMWVITNIASSDKPEYTAKIIRDGAIPLIIDLLKCPNYALQEQAAWALGNIAGDGEELKNMLVTAGTLSAFKQVCKEQFDAKKYAVYTKEDEAKCGQSPENQYISLMQIVSWSLSNFCRYKESKQANLAEILECLYLLLNSADAEKLVLAADEEDGGTHQADSFGANIGWSFCYLTNNVDLDEPNSFLIETMNRHGITQRLIKLLHSKNVYTKNSVLRAVGNVLTGSDQYTAKCIEYGVLHALYQLLKFYLQYQQKSGARTQQQSDAKLKEICWAISNITAGPKEHVIAVIEHNFIPILVDVLKTSRSGPAQEALWAISNATSHCDARIMFYLVENGLIQALCVFAKNRFYQQQYSRQHDKLLLVYLECMENILALDDVQTHPFAVQFEEYGGVELLEYLQSDDSVSQGIYDKVVNIIKTHFGAEDEEGGDAQNGSNMDEVDISCSQNQQTGQFQFGLASNPSVQQSQQAPQESNAPQSNTYSFQF